MHSYENKEQASKASPLQREPAQPSSESAGAGSRAYNTSWVAKAGPAVRLSTLPITAGAGPQIQRVELGSDEAQTDVIRRSAEAGVKTPAGRLPFAERIQKAFGRHDVSGVKAHLGTEAAGSARAMNAAAYATGDHVVFEGTPDLHTASHEAAHVVQQRGGLQLAGGIGQVGDPYEQHADAVADRVAAGQSAEALLDRFAGVGGGAPAIQHLRIDVTYGAEGRLIMNTEDLAKKNVAYFKTFPLEARLAIKRFLDRAAPSSAEEMQDIESIEARLNITGLNTGVNIVWSGNDAVARLPDGTQVAHAEFADYDGNDHYWLMYVETKAEYQKLGIGKTLIQAAVERFGAVYASSASKQEHEDRDDQDTRYLTGEGAALVNSCIKAGIMQPGWLFNPFHMGAEEDDDDM